MSGAENDNDKTITDVPIKEGKYDKSYCKYYS